MARLTKADSVYRMSLHKNGGYMYATTHPYTVTEDGKRMYSCLHWGTVTDELKFIPGKQYLYASPEERAKLIFPEGWDLSEIEKLQSNRGQGRPAYEGADVNRFYGDVWLMEQVADKVGLRTDLMATFHENAEIVNDVLTLAYYSFTTGNSWSRAARWQKLEKAPSSRELIPMTITRLTRSISETERMNLFKYRADRLGKDELCAVDSTTRSAYGSSLADIKWGRDKEHVPLPQTSEVVVYSLDSHMPVYYRTFSGNIPDSRSVETILTDISHAGFPRVILVTDRGYESVQNLEKYILRGQTMIMCVKMRQKIVLDRIAEFGTIGGKPGDMLFDPESRLYHKQYDLEYDVRGNGDTIHKADRMKLNLFFDPFRRAAEQTELEVAVEMQRRSLQSILDAGGSVDDDESIKKNYNWYEVSYDKKDRKLLSFSLDEKKIENVKKTSGFFGYITLGLDYTALQTLDAYGLRDEQEKYFCQMKTQMGFDRQRNWSEEGKTGRLLILFVGLIISSYVRHIWKTTGLKKQFASTQDILDEMRSIRCIEHNGRAKFITPFVGTQKDICKAFGFDIPEGCGTEYKSRKVSPKRRGRPAKAKTAKLDSYYTTICNEKESNLAVYLHICIH